MNNKMAINTYLSTTESKKQTKQPRRTDIVYQIWKTFGWLPDERGFGGMDEKMKGLRNTN